MSTNAIWAKITSWFWGEPAAPPPKIRIVKRDIMRLTIDEWRSSTELCSAARQMLHSPVLRQMLDVLRTNAPGLGMLPDSASPNDRFHWQSKGEGYIAALIAMESLAVPRDEPVELEATFEPEETEINP